MVHFFNLDRDDIAFSRQKKIFCLVIYDIISSRTRVKLANLLSGYGLRVQKSCFEIQLLEIEYGSLLKDIEKLVQPNQGDSVIIYKCRKEDIYAFNRYQSVEAEPECIFL